jgi:malonate transporter and related proteins
MIQALSGFALIGVIVAVGWVVGRWAGLPANTETVLGRLVYSVLTPCLLFTGVAAADPGLLLSEPVLVTTGAALGCMSLHLLVTRGRDLGTKVTGALSAGYVNANYIGIPVATYVLGDPTLVVPIVLLQLLIITPIALTLLEVATTGRASARTTLTTPLRNPLIIAVALGLLSALSGVRLPKVLADPVATIGAAAVPVVLIAYGISLHSRRVLAPGPDRLPTAAAVALKFAGMPALAFALARALRMPAVATYAVTVLSGLPTAQNIFLYAQRFGTGLTLVRDAIFLSTALCVPALLTVAFLFTR